MLFLAPKGDFLLSSLISRKSVIVFEIVGRAINLWGAIKKKLLNVQNQFKKEAERLRKTTFAIAQLGEL